MVHEIKQGFERALATDPETGVPDEVTTKIEAGFKEALNMDSEDILE